MTAGYILVYDSGVGGVSTLCQLRRRLPQEDFLYFADHAHAPYGDQQKQQILQWMEENLAALDQPLKALVIACNTATSAAAASLRQRLSLPVLGIEPALKPASLATAGQIVVLGTKLTLAEEKFRALVAQLDLAQRLVALPCPGLMELIEQDPAAPAVQDYWQRLLAPYEKSMRALVLGCTHYHFLRPALAARYPALPVFDGSEGLSRHLQRVLTEQGLLGGGSGRLCWRSSGGEIAVQRCRRLYAWAQQYLLTTAEA